MAQNHTPDVTVSDHGTIWQFHLNSPEARAWVEDNVSIASYMGQWDSENRLLMFSADWRMGRDILHGMINDGLTYER
jgi:hypothetical protein